MFIVSHRNIPLPSARIPRLAARIAAVILASTSFVWSGSGDAQPATSKSDAEALRRALAADAEQRPQNAAPLPAAASPTAAFAGLQAAQPPSSSRASRFQRLQTILPDISLILDTAAAAFIGAPSAQTGGHDPQDTGFNLQQLELHMQSSVDPYFQFETNIVFAQFGVEVEEAYARTTALPGGLQLRAGQFLARAGRSNPTHPHAWHFVDQALTNGKFFGSEGQRGLGTELSWLVPLPWYAEAVVGAAMADGACCSRSFDGSTKISLKSPTDLVWNLRLEQFADFTPNFGALVGVGVLLGPNSTGNGNRTAIGIADLTLRYRDQGDPQRRAYTWTTELMGRRRQIPGALLQDMGITSSLVAQLALRWEAGIRFEHVQGVQGDPLDPTWTGDRTRVAAQATFYPSHFSRLRTQLAWDRRRSDDQTGVAAFLALEMLIGAHGAHDY
jgi:hypothetical protein